MSMSTTSLMGKIHPGPNQLTLGGIPNSPIPKCSAYSYKEMKKKSPIVLYYSNNNVLTCTITYVHGGAPLTLLSTHNISINQTAIDTKLGPR